MSSQMPQSVVIVGAGHAGGRAAMNLRRHGFSGKITILGDESYPPYERPPLSKGLLVGSVSVDSTYLMNNKGWLALNIDMWLDDAATSIDRGNRSVHLVSGKSVSYDSLILATGARARLFPGIMDNQAPAYTLRTLSDCASLRFALERASTIGILGAGFVGLEVASSAINLGIKVVMFDTAPRLLTRLLPSEFSRWLAHLHSNHGVDLRFNCNVTKLRDGAIVLDGGEEIPVDATIVAIGALPNDTLAVSAGLLCDDGVIVDADCRTTDSSIYAIGDVARRKGTSTQPSSRIESWRKAEDDALKVSAVISGNKAKPDDVPWFWTDQLGHNIQLAGSPSDRFEVLLCGEPDQGPFLVYYLDQKIIRGVIGVDCGRDVQAIRQLIRNAAVIDVSKLGPPKIKKREIIDMVD